VTNTLTVSTGVSLLLFIIEWGAGFVGGLYSFDLPNYAARFQELKQTIWLFVESKLLDSIQDAKR